MKLKLSSSVAGFLRSGLATRVTQICFTKMISVHTTLSIAVVTTGRINLGSNGNPRPAPIS
eukprot:10055462-Prorocentrum_lima.AAC.1